MSKLFTQVAIEAMAFALPPEVFSSEEIESELSPLYDRLKLPRGRLELMTGIKERRFWPSNHRPSLASAEAGQKLLDLGVAKDEIDFLFMQCSCKSNVGIKTYHCIFSSC